jgi:hypothetical protein
LAAATTVRMAAALAGLNDTWAKPAPCNASSISVDFSTDGVPAATHNPSTGKPLTLSTEIALAEGHTAGPGRGWWRIGTPTGDDSNTTN